MLAAGGTKHHSELLKPFGLDARDPTFWQGGLGVIERMIDGAGEDWMNADPDAGVVSRDLSFCAKGCPGRPIGSWAEHNL